MPPPALKSRRQQPHPGFISTRTVLLLAIVAVFCTSVYVALHVTKAQRQASKSDLRKPTVASTIGVQAAAGKEGVQGVEPQAVQSTLESIPLPPLVGAAPQQSGARTKGVPAVPAAASVVAAQVSSEPAKAAPSLAPPALAARTGAGGGGGVGSVSRGGGVGGADGGNANGAAVTRSAVAADGVQANAGAVSGVKPKPAYEGRSRCGPTYPETIVASSLDELVSSLTGTIGIQAVPYLDLADDYVLPNHKTVLANRAHNKGLCETFLGLKWKSTTYRLWEHGFSQSGQDLWLWDEVFGGKKQGFFVDVGAFDGQTHSNSAGFEYCLDWSGLLVEANPVQIESIKQWRPCSVTYNVAASETNKMCTFVSKLDPELSGLQEGVKTAPQAGDKLLDVPCIRLGDLFARHGISKIDYLSVDMEGVEPLALRSIDYDKVQIDVIGIEENGKTAELKGILEPKGFEVCKTLGPDIFFCRKGFAAGGGAGGGGGVGSVSRGGGVGGADGGNANGAAVTRSAVAADGVQANAGAVSGVKPKPAYEGRSRCGPTYPETIVASSLDELVSSLTGTIGIQAVPYLDLADDYVLPNHKTVLANRAHNKGLCETFLGLKWKSTTYRLWEHGFSQSGQDLWLWDEVFGGKKQGFFVDVGAFDGQTHSNSAGFEYCLDWSGLLVEANPVQIESIKQWRPCSVTYNVAASETNKMCTFVSKLDPELSGLQEGVKTAPQAGDKLLDVPCIRLGDLFARHGISKIDYLSVDMEGVEPLALRSIDYDKVQIDVIGIEENGKTAELKGILEPKGFEVCKTLGPDIFFCRKGFFK